MSAGSSTVRGSLPTACTSPASSTPGSASPTPGGEKSSPCASPASRSTPTREQLGLGLPEGSMSSPAGSPARAPAPLGFATGLTMPRPFCGERWPEPLASYDPATSSWRTWRTSLLSTTEPSGEKFSQPWPRSGTTRSGIACQQRPSAPRTSVTGFSPLLPTPRASARENRQMERTPSQEAGTHGESLGAEVAALLPTPTATEYGNNQSPSEGAAIRPSLPALVRLLPTPVKGDGKGSRQSTAVNPRSPAPTLSDLAFLWSGGRTSAQSVDGRPSPADLRLSPWFVEWMIGAPPGWSDPACPLSATEFKSRSVSSSDGTSSSLSGNG